jgi:hypothetical protein
VLLTVKLVNSAAVALNIPALSTSNAPAPELLIDPVDAVNEKLPLEIVSAPIVHPPIFPVVASMVPEKVPVAPVILPLNDPLIASI